MWIVQKIKRESLVIQLPDSSLTELNNYNFYSMKEGFFMFGKKKKVKHAERHVDYKVSSENLAMPELHIGEDKGEEQPEKKDDVYPFHNWKREGFYEIITIFFRSIS